MTALYHGADTPRAVRIMRQGFSEADETQLGSHDRCGILLSADPDQWTKDGRLFVDVLLRVELAPGVNLAAFTDPTDRDQEAPIYWVPALSCRGAAITQEKRG
jgi:hypothetical protein